jgi:probable phosphoglycerate mutase
MPTTLYLARHGQTLWNLAGRVQGSGNSPLTELGMEQARRLGQRLLHTELDAIYASAAPRAIHSAELARGERSIPIIADPDLCEMGFGPWEGLTGDEIRVEWEEQLTNYWRRPHLYHPPAGGETFEQVQGRLTRAAWRIAAAHTGRAVLVIGHGAALKTLLAYFAGRPLAQLWTPPILGQTSLSIVEIEAGVGRLLLEGDLSHLAAPEPAG